jgi:lysophospholipase L1-like esterase
LTHHGRAGCPGPALTIVALGDSTTAGTPGFLSPVEAPPDGSGDVTSQYAWWLKQAEPSWRVLNRGINRERTEAIAARMERDVFGHAPDVLVLLAGVNDVYDGDAPDAIQHRLEAMYTRALAADMPVVACSIIPFDTATAEHNACMRAVNAWIRETCTRTPHMAFCDTRAATAHPEAPDRLRESPDGLHPSPAVYRAMADALAPVVREVLGVRG